MVRKVRSIPLKKYIVLFTFFWLTGLLPAPAEAGLTPGRMDTGLNVGAGADSHVYTLAIEPDGDILVGGAFNSINGAVHPFLTRVRKDGDSGAFNAQVDGVVYIIALQPDLRIVIGGFFSTVNGITRQKIARLNPNGSLDTGFNPGLDLSAGMSFINTIVIQPDGKIIIGGNFTIGGHHYLARLNTDGSLDNSFHLGTALNGMVTKIALQSDGRILLGGGFTLVNGISRNRITRLNSDGSPDPTFNPGTGADDFVDAIIVQADQKIIIGGSFLIYNGTSRKRLARLNPDGMLDTGFVADQDSWVSALAFLPDGRFLAAGSFSPPLGCPTCKFIARYSANGTLDPSFTPVALNGFTIYAMAFQDDYGIVIGGDFTAQHLLTAQKNLARLNPDGTVDSGFSLAAVNGWVMAAAVDDWGKTYVGGLFQNQVNTLVIPPLLTCPRNSIARLNGDGTCDTTFSPGAGANGWVFTLALDSDRSIYLGGDFTTIDSKSMGGIAKLNPDGSVNTTFNPIGVGGWVSALAPQPDQHLLIGGFFNNVNWINQHNLARLKPNGDLDTDFKGWTDQEVLVLARQADGKILVGGKFTQVNGTPRTYLVRLNPDGSLDATFNPNINNEVWAIRIQADEKILIGGTFTLIDGVARSGIARLLPNGVLDTGFNPGTGTNGPVAGIATQRDGRILIGGLFATFNSINRNGIARLNPDGSLNPDFDPGTGAAGINPLTLPGIRAIIPQDNGRILIGGPFDQYDGTARLFLGRLNGHSATAFLGQPPGTAELGKPFYHALQATGLPSPRFQVTSGTLPPGVTLSRYTGILSGIPQQVGTFTITVSAYNQFPPTASQAFTLTVENALIHLPLILRH